MSQGFRYLFLALDIPTLHIKISQNIQIKISHVTPCSPDIHMIRVYSTPRERAVTSTVAFKGNVWLT